MNHLIFKGDLNNTCTFLLGQSCHSLPLTNHTWDWTCCRYMNGPILAGLQSGANNCSHTTQSCRLQFSILSLLHNRSCDFLPDQNAFLTTFLILKNKDTNLIVQWFKDVQQQHSSSPIIFKRLQENHLKNNGQNQCSRGQRGPICISLLQTILQSKSRTALLSYQAFLQLDMSCIYLIKTGISSIYSINNFSIGFPRWGSYSK